MMAVNLSTDTGLFEQSSSEGHGSFWGGLRLYQHRYLLVLRAILANLTFCALSVMMWFQGWLETVVHADSTRLTWVIAGLFLIGIIYCFRRIWQISEELNAVALDLPPKKSRVFLLLERAGQADAQARSNLLSSLKLKLSNKISPVKHIANSLVLLGLIGTVIGFIIALSGVDPELANDASSVAPMVATLIDGMSVALYTTLVGAVLNIWLMFNYRVLEGGAIGLLTQIADRVEANHGRV